MVPILRVRDEDGNIIGIPAIRGEPGESGVSPTVKVATISGGHRVTITAANGTQVFDVMNGKDGSGGGGTGGGADGEDGVTFYPNVDSAGNLTWTNDGGLINPDPVNIMGPPGPAGAAGAKGDPGYTPVKGKDYWTAADKAEIVDAVLANFTDVSEVGL